MQNRKSTMFRLLSGSGLRVLQLMVSVSIGFFMLPFMIGRLGNVMYGLWVLAGSFSAAYGLLDLGLSAATGRFVAVAFGTGDFKEANRYVNTSFVIYCFVGVFAFSVALVVAHFAFIFVEDHEQGSILKTVVFIIGTEVAISFPMRALIGTVNARLRYDITAGIEIGFRVLSTAGMVAILLMGWGVVQLAVFALGFSIFRFIMWYEAVRRVNPEIEVSLGMASRRLIRGLLSFSAFAFICQIADLLRFKIDSFVIAAYLGPNEVTRYTIAATLAKYLISGTIAIMGVLSVIFAQQHGRNDLEATRRTLHFGIRVATSVVSFMGFGLIAWGRPFIERWIGLQYVDAYPCLVAIVIGLMIALWQTSTFGVLYGRAKHHFVAISNSVEAVANLICSIIFIRYWGIFGVALGTCVPMIAIKVTFQPAIVSRVIGIPLSRYFLWLLRAVFLSSIALLIPSIITYYCVGPEYPALILTSILCSLSYFPAVGLLNFSAEERHKVWNAIAKNVK